MKRVCLILAAFLALAGCGNKKRAVVNVPPPPAPVVAPRRTPKPPPVPVAVPEPQPPTRPPMALQSTTDPVVERTTAETHLREAQALLTAASQRTLTGAAKDDRDRAAAMVTAARKALDQGDFRQANDVALRAATLAKTLLPNK